MKWVKQFYGLSLEAKNDGEVLLEKKEIKVL